MSSYSVDELCCILILTSGINSWLDSGWTLYLIHTQALSGTAESLYVEVSQALVCSGAVARLSGQGVYCCLCCGTLTTFFVPQFVE